MCEIAVSVREPANMLERVLHILSLILKPLFKVGTTPTLQMKK